MSLGSSCIAAHLDIVSDEEIERSGIGRRSLIMSFVVLMVCFAAFVVYYLLLSCLFGALISLVGIWCIVYLLSVVSSQ